MLLAITVVITLVAPPIWSQAPGQAPGTWEPAADLQQGRAGHTATLEVYDPFTDIFTSLSSHITTVRSAHLGLTLLYSGKVRIAGGTSARQLVETAEVFDPIQGTFQAIESPGTAPGLFGATV